MDMEKPVALIIEDEIYVAEFYAFVLNEAGYEVIIALNGRSALEELGRYQPALIMLDMHLPDANGQDLLNYIRQNPGNNNVYVILATGQPQMVDKLADGLANFILVKPIEYSQLLKIVQRVFKSPQY